MENVIFRFRGMFGIPVEIGQSIFGFVLIMFLLGASSGDPFQIVLFLVVILGSIYLHEVGHAWGYRVQGLAVDRILLYGGGGLCFGAASAKPRQMELIVAMGPIVNLVLWAVAGIAQWALFSFAMSGGVSSQFMAEVVTFSFKVLAMIKVVNIWLFAFNMMPVQPLDGGRLFHLAMVRILPPDAALRITGKVGLVFCFLWIPAMIALFVFAGWILFFFPSFKMHMAMSRGERTY